MIRKDEGIMQAKFAGGGFLMITGGALLLIYLTANALRVDVLKGKLP